MFNLPDLRNKIFAKILISVCASIFVILFSSFYFFDQFDYEEKKNELVKHQNLITQSQAIIIPPHIAERDEERITLLLSGILSNPAIIGVAGPCTGSGRSARIPTRSSPRRTTSPGSTETVSGKWDAWRPWRPTGTLSRICASGAFSTV